MVAASTLSALGINDLGVPPIFVTDPYEDILAAARVFIVDKVRYGDEGAGIVADPALADGLTEMLQSDSEVAAKVLQAMCLFYRHKVEGMNDQALQTFSTWARSTALDAKAADRGVKRQLLMPADPDATPPRAAVYESDEDLLVRYRLSPYRFSSAGPAPAYVFHALSLGAAPKVSLDSPEANVISVRYDFSEDPPPFSPADAELARNGANLDIYVLGRDGDGVLSADQLQYITDYLESDRVGVFTDKIQALPAEGLDFALDLTVRIYAGADASVISSRVTAAAEAYVASLRKFDEPVLRSRIDELAHKAGAVEVVINSPVADIRPALGQWARCTGVTVGVDYL